MHSTGDDQSPLPTPGMKGGGGGKVVGRWWRGDSGESKK